MAGRRPAPRRPLLANIKRINGEAQLVRTQRVRRGPLCLTPSAESEYGITLPMIGLGATLR